MKNIKDSLFFEDNKQSKKSTLWCRTSVSGYRGYKVDPKTGKSSWDEVLFEDEENIVTLSGVQLAMESIFGVQGAVTIPTLKDDIGAGPANATYSNTGFQSPDGLVNHPNPLGYRVCLFGIGLAGSGENNITKYPVNYREKSLQLTKTAEDGTNLNGIMLPFRYTKTELTDAEKKKYFGKKQENGFAAYYLKAFDAPAAIKHVWDATGTTGITDITNDQVWDLSKKSPVSSYTEFRLKVAETDVKEWVTATGSISDPRFNVLALYSGFYNAGTGDYENVKMFSKLYIATENLSLAKDVDLIYKVYGA